MNAIDDLFARLRSAGRRAFMPFLTAGDPSLDATGQLLDTVVANGADMVEIGLPYSDPIADGVVVQASYTRALAAGFKLDAFWDHAARWAARHPQTPLVVMTAYSLVFRPGPTKFLDRLKAAGFAGAIVPDLPVDEAETLAEATRQRDLRLIQLVTPTTPPDRAVRIARQATGFLYCVSVTGITGTRDQLPPELRQQLLWLRGQTQLPLCVGFGVSKPEHVRALRDVADGVIVGSALVRLVEQAKARPLAEVAGAVGDLARSLRGALDEAG